MQSWLRSEPPLAQVGLLEAGVPWFLALHWLQLPQPLQERQALSVESPARVVDSGSVASTEHCLLSLPSRVKAASRSSEGTADTADCGINSMREATAHPASPASSTALKRCKRASPQAARLPESRWSIRLAFKPFSQSQLAIGRRACQHSQIGPNCLELLLIECGLAEPGLSSEVSSSSLPLAR